MSKCPYKGKGGGDLPKLTYIYEKSAKKKFKIREREGESREIWKKTSILGATSPVMCVCFFLWRAFNKIGTQGNADIYPALPPPLTH